MLKEVYENISIDEGRHAKLGWDIVIWVLESTNGREREKIENTLHKTLDHIEFQRSHTRHNIKDDSPMDETLNSY